MEAYRVTVRCCAALALWACCFAIAPALRADDEAVEVFRRVASSVVRIESPDSAGSGMLVSTDGLILTNAHVMVSPLAFRCVLQRQGSEGVETVTFQHVEIVGFHPTLDMALLRIDPAEHSGELQPVTFCHEEVTTGQQVFAIGNPSTAEIALNNSITQGILSGADREVEGQRYYQVDAPVNRGNSGGPLCNSQGEVIGMVTFKLTQAESISFAIPLSGFEPEDFVPLAERERDPATALHYQLLGHESHANASRAARGMGALSDEDIASYEKALAYYQTAMLYDPTNAALYYNAGMMLRTLQRHSIAQGYFTECIRLDPWTESFHHYRELGLCLAKQGKWEEAMNAWQEGIAKHPREAIIWEDLAVTHGILGEAYAASYASGVVLALDHPDSRRETVAYIHQLNFDALDEAEAAQVEQELERLNDALERRAAFAASQEENGVVWMTNEFEDYMQQHGAAPPPE